MKVNMYSVYDKVAKIFNSPIFLSSDEVALRQVKAIAHDAASMFAQFPDDYKLVKLGSVDLETGVICTDDAVCVCDGFKQLLTSVSDGGKL